MNMRGPHICGEAIDVRVQKHVGAKFQKLFIDWLYDQGNVLLTGSWTVNNSIQIWDLNSGKAIETVTPHNRAQTIDGEFLYCTQFFHGDNTGNTILTGGSGTGFVEVINIADKKIICFFKLNKTVQTLDSYYDRVVFGGTENSFKIAEYAG